MALKVDSKRWVGWAIAKPTKAVSKKMVGLTQIPSVRSSTHPTLATIYLECGGFNYVDLRVAKLGKSFSEASFALGGYMLLT
ncbi:MAG: hypothetical protein DRR19_21520 [Candidatus Parabeggiatoa sp. nov. 1]|nr:MAG: hypothetical protein DRR19_21520 [Gammaproteobacteria bacterium]